jgi:antitoxin (DNA-binding transcriptional repressor) of toxin-antitoxin stability system
MSALPKQYIVDETGQPVAVIVPIDEYEALVQEQPTPDEHQTETPKRKSPYGALKHLGGPVPSAEEIDEARRELWSVWDREV